MERLGPEAERYLREVVAGLPIWVRGEVLEELHAHVAEAIRRRVASGADEATAEAATIEAFGPADELRRELVRVHRRSSSTGLAWLYAILGWLSRLPIDWLAPIRLLTRRPLGNFHRDYALGRYDAIITRGERELRARGPRFDLHHELGLAYNAIGEHDRAFVHLRAEVDWLQQHPLPRLLGRSMALATAYSNLAGVLESLGRLREAEEAVLVGLAADNRHQMLHLQRAKHLVARGQREEALRHLELALDDSRVQPRGQAVLMVTQDVAFDAIRHEPRFTRVLLRAVAG